MDGQPLFIKNAAETLADYGTAGTTLSSFRHQFEEDWMHTLDAAAFKEGRSDGMAAMKQSGLFIFEGDRVKLA
ncbi:hypothetical protein Ddc_20228 [Ditylenchus destructor]|nr:hypothetical protein Ddc_20228 [Ditylenchus destructor]